jgi:hypothetical protein
MMNKNNKILIYEIAKMQKLMTGTLILEQFTELIDDVIKYAGKLAGKLPDNVEQLIAKLSKVATEEETIKILADMAKYSDEMASIIVPRVMATISDVERKYINDFKLVLKDAVENGMDIERLKTSADDWVNKNVKTQFDGVQDIIKKEFTDYVDDVARKVNPPTPPTPPTPPKPKPKPKPNDITDITGQSWESITPLSSDELKKLEKMYRQKGLGKSFFRAMRTFWKSVEDMMTKQTELMDETLSLIKSYDTVTNAAQKVDIAKRIGDNVQTLTQKDKVNYQIINEWIDTNVIDYKVKSKIKSADGYMDAAKIFDGKALEEWKKTYKGMSDRRLSILKQANSMLNPFSWSKGMMKKNFGNVADSYSSQVAKKWKAFVKGPEFAELRRYILTGQSQSWKGIDAFRKEFGFIPAMGNVTKELAYSYVALSFILAVIDYVTDILGNQVRNVESINDWGLIKKQIESFDEHINKENTNNESQIEKSGKGFTEFFGDLFDYGIDELKDINVGIPGLIDNFFAWIHELRNGEVSQENAEKLEKQGENLRKETERARQEIIDREKETVKTYSSDLFYREYPCYTSVLDTNYNEDGFIKGVKIINPKTINLRGNTDEIYVAFLRNGNWYFNDGTQIKC